MPRLRNEGIACVFVVLSHLSKRHVAHLSALLRRASRASVRRSVARHGSSCFWLSWWVTTSAIRVRQRLCSILLFLL
ncbi:hypothetical protein HAX54_051664, partial [Datura stramonium]|nr:hypothetical protein [Datura stramonium]